MATRFVTKDWMSLLAIVTALWSAPLAATSDVQEDAGKLAPLLGSMGDYSYPVSNCSAAAQQYFDQGLRFVYAYQFAEAVASFREAARLDPDCPMAHWGEALAIAPNPNNRYLQLPDDRQGAGAQAIRRATLLAGEATEKERGLIEALGIIYDSSETDRPSRDLAYIEATRGLWERYPEDLEIATLYGHALMTASPWDYWTPDGKPRPGTEEAEAAFSRVLERYPDHPGANHSYIHLMENSQHPEQALPHAERLAEVMPGSGHYVHMSSHIYIVTGRYADIVESNHRSLAADEALLVAWGDRELPTDVVSYTTSAGLHGVHARDFLHFAAVARGNYAEAMEQARMIASMSKPMFTENGAAARRVVRPWLTQKRFGKWQDILQESLPEGSPAFVEGIWHYARGSAFAATGKLSDAERELEAVREAADEKPYGEGQEGQDLPKLTRASVAKTYSGDIAGEGQVEYVMMYRGDGSASFVGLERVVARIAGKAGTFVLQRTGVLEGGQAKESYFVIAGSATGELHGLLGDGTSAVGHGMEHPLTVNYEFT